MARPESARAGIVIADGASALLDIAGIRMEISCDRPLAAVGLDPAYGRFVSSGQPRLSVECSYVDGPLESPADARRLFDSQGLWTLHEAGGDLVFVLEDLDGGGGPYRIARFDRGFVRGEITSRACGRARVRGPLLPDPFEYPLGEAVTMSLLGLGHGLMVHACGLSIDGDGVLLVGHSGAGKSTIARLAADAAIVLNDDRIIVTMEDGRPRMYGTPWHGDHPGVDPRGAAIRAIFFIEHARAGSVTPIRGAAAAAELIARSFPPVWSAGGMGFSLGLAAELVAAAPCFRMGFTPDRGVLELMRCAV